MFNSNISIKHLYWIASPYTQQKSYWEDFFKQRTKRKIMRYKTSWFIETLISAKGLISSIVSQVTSLSSQTHPIVF